MRHMRHLLLFALLPHGCQESPQICCKKMKNQFSVREFLTCTSLGPCRPLDPSLDFLTLSFLKFHSCKSVQADPSLRHMRHLLLLAFLPHRCEESPKFAVKNEKSVCGGGALTCTSPGSRQPLDPCLDFLVLSFPKFHPCKSVQADWSLRHTVRVTGRLSGQEPNRLAALVDVLSSVPFSKWTTERSHGICDPPTTKWVVMCQDYFCRSKEFAAGVWKCPFWDFGCNCLRNHLSLVCSMEIANF